MAFRTAGFISHRHLCDHYRNHQSTWTYDYQNDHTGAKAGREWWLERVGCHHGSKVGVWHCWHPGKDGTGLWQDEWPRHHPGIKVCSIWAKFYSFYPGGSGTSGLSPYPRTQPDRKGDDFNQRSHHSERSISLAFFIFTKLHFLGVAVGYNGIHKIVLSGCGGRIQDFDFRAW